MIQSCTLLQLPAAARHGLELRTDVSKTQLPRSIPRGSAHRGFQLRAVEAGVFGNVAAMAGGEIRLKGVVLMRAWQVQRMTHRMHETTRA